jgi:RNA polymerase sigma-70 factor (ECF subfamily)
VPEPEWESIFRANSSIVTTAALRVLGCVADAEDVAQEVFIEVINKWNPAARHSWPGLLRRMAICRALDLVRARKGTDPLELHLVDVREAEPSELLIKREHQHQLRAAVASLPRRESEVFCLACFERLSHEEIGDVLKISRGSVATALSKARAKLNEMFQIVQGDIK